MKKINFKLISNQNIVIDQIVNSLEDDKSLKFKIDDELYEYQKDRDILTKRKDESIISIDFKQNQIKIILNSINQEFFLDIFDTNIKKDADKITLTYTFINDAKTTNCIIIEYR